MSENIEKARPYAISAFRFVVGLLFTCHGVAGLFGAFHMPAAEVGSWPGWYAAVIQFFGGILVMIGLGTRPAAFIASGSMAYAYFKVHQPEAFWPMGNGGEASAMFCWTLFLLVFIGPGPISLDALLGRRSTATAIGEEHQKPVTA